MIGLIGTFAVVMMGLTGAIGLLASMVGLGGWMKR